MPSCDSSSEQEGVTAALTDWSGIFWKPEILVDLKLAVAGNPLRILERVMSVQKEGLMSQHCAVN